MLLRQRRELLARDTANSVLFGASGRQRRLGTLELAGPQAHEPRVVQLAHVVGRHAESDHDLGERVALLQALEHERGELSLGQLRST